MVMSDPTGPRIRSTASSERQPQHALAVHLGDEVARLDPGAVGRRAVDRRDHLDEAVLLRDLDAEAAELAPGLHPHVVEVVGRADSSNAGRAGEHAVDRRLDQLLVVDLLDVRGADPLEDVAEQVELLVDRLLLVGLLREQRAGELGGHHHSGNGAAEPANQIFFIGVFPIRSRRQQRFRIDRPLALSDLDIKRFAAAAALSDCGRITYSSASGDGPPIRPRRSPRRTVAPVATRSRARPASTSIVSGSGSSSTT